jgi:uncharacterized protein affecting Mg2+/Co2+ transport
MMTSSPQASLDDVPLEALFPFLDTLTLARYGAVSSATRARLAVAFYAWDAAILRDFAQVPPPPPSPRDGSFRANILRTTVSRATWFNLLTRIEGSETASRRRGRFAKAVALRGVASRVTLALRTLTNLAAAVLQASPLSAPPTSAAVDAYENELNITLPASARVLLTLTNGQSTPIDFATHMAGLMGGLDVYDNQMSTALLPGGIDWSAEATLLLRVRRGIPHDVVALTGVRHGACILLDCTPSDAGRPRGALYALTRAAGVALPASAGAAAADASCCSKHEGPLEDSLLDWIEARVAALRACSDTATAVDTNWGTRVLFLPAWPVPNVVGGGSRGGRGSTSTVTRGVRIGVGAAPITELGGVPKKYAAPFAVGMELTGDEKAVDWSSLFPALRGSRFAAAAAAAGSSLRWGLQSLVFTYRVRIERGEEIEQTIEALALTAPSVTSLRRCALTLTTREWTFGANDGAPQQHVAGPGVIGLFPRLEAPSAIERGTAPSSPPFEYASLTEVKNPPGWMEGALFFAAEGSETEIRAVIARFELDLPSFVFS